MKKRADFVDLTGRVFGDLTVDSLAFVKNKVSHWKCTCVCGRERIIRAFYLTQGLRTACTSCSKAKNVGRHYIDMTGKRLGKLTVLHVSHYNTKSGQYYWRCLCDCGKETVINGSSLRRSTRSCGCLVTEASQKRSFIDLTGRRFGRLVVQEFVGVSKRMRRWKCICDCGKTTIACVRDLSTGHTQSCGCFKRDRTIAAMKLRRLPNNEAGLNHLYRSYREKNAKRRGLPFELTKDEFQALTKQDCHYCGEPPSKDKLGYKYNGIDRVDSDLGYTVANTVSCCYPCNIAKHEMTTDEFLQWVERVHDFQEGKKLRVVNL